jgi:hypothetical protein
MHNKLLDVLQILLFHVALIMPLKYTFPFLSCATL